MIACQDCGYDNQPNTDFCEICGSDLSVVTNITPSDDPPLTTTPSISVTAPVTTDPLSSDLMEVAFLNTTSPPMPTAASSASSNSNFSNTASAGTRAKLVSRQAGSPIPEFELDADSMIVGIFDSSSGPPDIDLESFVGSDTVSREHAEIFLEGGYWKVKDLSSTNGIFIKKHHQSRFGGRIISPEVLEDGDEIAFAKVKFTFRTA
jgi:hypothetical protein